MSYQEQNQFLYPGKGRPMRKVVASTGNSTTDSTHAETTTIPDGSYSETIAAHDCKELTFLFEFAAAATGSIVIQEVIDAEASVAGETFDTVTVTAERVSRWNAGEPLSGFFRFLNSSGQNVVAYAQKKI